MQKLPTKLIFFSALVFAVLPLLSEKAFAELVFSPYIGAGVVVSDTDAHKNFEERITTTNELDDDYDNNFSLESVNAKLILGLDFFTYKKITFGLEYQYQYINEDSKEGFVAPGTLDLDFKDNHLLLIKTAYLFGEKHELHLLLGLAWGYFEAETTPRDHIDDFNEIGFACGAGYQYSFTDNWAVRVDYMYTDYDNDFKTSRISGNETYSVFYDEIRMQQVDLAIIYKF